MFDESTLYNGPTNKMLQSYFENVITYVWTICCFDFIVNFSIILKLIVYIAIFISMKHNVVFQLLKNIPIVFTNYMKDFELVLKRGYIYCVFY